MDGSHVVADFYDCPAALLDDVDLLLAHACRAAEAAGATILEVVAHQFEPQGVTVLLLLAESHLSIHTWPETGMAYVDCFTCGESTDPEIAVDYLAMALECGSYFGGYMNRPQVKPGMAQPRGFWQSLLGLWR